MVDTDRAVMNIIFNIFSFFIVVSRAITSKVLILGLFVFLYSCSSSVTIENLLSSLPISNVTPITLNFANTNVSVIEGAGQVNLVINLSKPRLVATEVNFQIEGSALLDSDFSLPSSSPIIIPAGSTEVILPIIILNDTEVESNETIILTLINPSEGVVIGSRLTHSVLIIDNDGPPQLVNFSPASSNRAAMPTVVVVNYSKIMHLASVQNVNHWSYTCSGGGIGNVTSVILTSNYATVNINTTVQPTHGSSCTLTALTEQLDTEGNALITNVSSSSVIFNKIDPARVVRVTSVTSDGWYRSGDAISVQVEFSENVVVSGAAPQITLETGDTDVLVDLTSGSGTSALSGSFNVQPGYITTDLNYVSTSSLNLNGGSILTQSNSMPADLNLPASNLSTALAAQKQIGIDTVPPVAPSDLLIDNFSSSLITSPVMTFNEGSDILSGVLRHEARIKRSDNSLVRDWSTVVSNSSLSGLVLLHNTQYYIELRAVDVAGNISNLITSHVWWVDTEGPMAVPAISLGSVPFGLSQSPVMSWAEVEDMGPSGVDHYEVQLLNSSNTVIRDWAPQVSGQAITGLSLVNGTQYFIRIRAVDRVGNLGVILSGANWVADQGDPCMAANPAVGLLCADGTYYIGEISGVRYFTTPGQCQEVPDPHGTGSCPGESCLPSSNFTATCSGGVDSLAKIWSFDTFSHYNIMSYPGAEGVGFWDINLDANSGSYNTTQIVQFTMGASPLTVAHYCEKMLYGAKSDWFLPNRRELDQLRRVGAAVQSTLGVQTNVISYWSSTLSAWSGDSWGQRFDNNSQNTITKLSPQLVRCFRSSVEYDQSPPTAPSALVIGAVPDSITRTPVLTFTSGVDQETSIKQHQAQVIRVSDNVVVRNWVSILSGESLSGLTLQDNIQYFVRLRAIDQNNNASLSVDSPSWTAAVTIFNCTENPPLGALCEDGSYYIGEISGVRYFTTPGNCQEVPAPHRAGICPGPHCYPTADFVATCSDETDQLSKSWNDGSLNYFDIPGITTFTGTTGTGFWDTNLDSNSGAHNTAQMVAITNSAEGGYHAAAHYCDKMQFGAKNDWFLPNIQELDQLRQIGSSNQIKLGVVTTSYYGDGYSSSSERSDTSMWVQGFASGSQGNGIKYNAAKIRCFRAMAGPF